MYAKTRPSAWILIHVFLRTGRPPSRPCFRAISWRRRNPSTRRRRPPFLINKRHKMGYNDHPDGKECFQKIWACTKYSGMLGLVVSTYDVLMYTKPQGYVPTLGAYVRSTVPLAGAGAVFAAVTCASTSLRGKDDKLNYFLGGSSAGGIIGVAARSFRVGVPTAFFLGVCAILYKDSKDCGWKLFPEVTHRVGSFDHVNYDFTLQKSHK